MNLYHQHSAKYPTRYQNKNATRHLLAVAIYLFCCLLSVACVDELSYGSSEAPGQTPAGSLLLTLQVPGIPAAGDAATRAASPADECRVDPARLHLLLFDQSGDKYVFYRYAAPTNLKEIAGSNPRRYTLDVPFKAGEFYRNYRMMVIANLPLAQLKKAGDGEDFPAFRACSDRDNPVEAVRNLINCDNPGDTQTGRWPAGGTAEGFTPFPMWRESAAFNARPQGNIGTLSLIRAVARIDVGINFKKNPDGTYPLEDMRSAGIRSNGNGRYFKLMSTSVYRIPRSAWIGPREENYNAQTGTVTAATATGDMAADAPRRYMETDLSTDPDAPTPTDAENRRALTRTVYVPEAANHGMNRDRAACLVIGGVYGEGNTATTYYRIDLYDRTPDPDGNIPKPTPENRLDILRNHAYVVNITSVSGPGAATEEEALQADNTNMEVELSDWNQDQPVGDITSDGVYSLNLSRTEQEYYSDGSPVDFTIETNYDGELGKGWQMEADDVAKQFVVFYDKAGHEITYGSPDWPALGKVGTTNLHIGWKEFEQPAGTTMVQTRQAVLTFTAGRMKVRCRLTQFSRELLKISFTPPEMSFTREPEYPQHVDIDVTTRNSYQLEVSWKNEAGENCTWNLTNPATNPTTFPDARFRAENFFVADPAGGYLLKPENLPAETSTPRTFVFTFTATGDSNGITGTNLLTVYQSTLNISWKVDGGQGPYKNEVIAAYTDQNAVVHIVAAPSNLEWYFSRPPDMGQAEWIINLDAIIGTKQTGSGEQTFNLQPNTKLGRRSYTLQARSPQGLDENHSKLILIQQGVPLELKPSKQGTPDAVTESSEGSDGKMLYTLDCGPGLNAATGQKIDMISNTDWLWQWDRTSPTFEKDYRNIFGTSFTANPAENSATTDGPADGTTRKTWAGAFAFNTTEQHLKEESALWADKENVPLGGVQGVTMDLRNKNVNLDEEDVEADRRRFRIQRAFPSYQNIMQWPSPDNENLDMHADEIVAGTEAPFTVRTNATGAVECYSGANKDNMTLTGRRDIVARQGYQEFTVPLVALGVPVDADSWKLPRTWVRLKYTGPKRETADAADHPAWSEERTYFYGREINKPARNMATGQRFLSPGQHQLIFDFSNSLYKKVKVRVRLETVNTSYDKRGYVGTVQDEYITDCGGASGSYITFPETRLIVTLPINNSENCLRRVWLEYLDEQSATWRKDVSPLIYQDGVPMNGYLVRYDDYPERINNGLWTGVSPLGTYSNTWVDEMNIAWLPASPLIKPELIDIASAQQSVNQATEQMLTVCTDTVHPILYGIGTGEWNSATGTPAMIPFSFIVGGHEVAGTAAIPAINYSARTLMNASVLDLGKKIEVPPLPMLKWRIVSTTYTITGYDKQKKRVAKFDFSLKSSYNPGIQLLPFNYIKDTQYPPEWGTTIEANPWTDFQPPADWRYINKLESVRTDYAPPPAVRTVSSGDTTGTTTYPE